MIARRGLLYRESLKSESSLTIIELAVTLRMSNFDQIAAQSSAISALRSKVELNDEEFEIRA